MKADVMTSTRESKVQNFSALVFTSPTQMCFTNSNVKRKLTVHRITPMRFKGSTKN